MKISIVTAALNRGDFVENAIRSVQASGVLDFEHLIIDGKSTDGSIEIYQKYPELCVYSEKDKNVYDAFNKGIERSTGDIIGILNTDDSFPSGILKEVVAIFEEDPSIEMVSGGCAFVDLRKGRKEALYRYLHPGILRLRSASLVRYPVMVNARFYRREVFEKKVGYFNVDFPVVSDRDFVLRCALAGLKNRELGKVTCEYGLHDAALSHKPDGVGEAVLEENLKCALSRIPEQTEGSGLRAYEFWAAWSIFLLCLHSLRQHRYKRVLSLCFNHSGLVFRQSVRLFIEMIQHVRERNLKINGA